MKYADVMAEMESLANPANVAGMTRYGISGAKMLGISVADLRKLARRAGKDHELAAHLWASGVHEARILAGMVDELAQVTEEQMERWVADFDSWDICDGCCMNLVDKTPFAYAKAVEWAGREPEFVKRAGFTLMARLAWIEKKADNRPFEAFLLLIQREAGDSRNFVKKAVNWALRQIGKRNRYLNGRAVAVAGDIALMPASSARWVAKDALRELTGEAVQRRLKD